MKSKDHTYKVNNYGNYNSSVIGIQGEGVAPAKGCHGGCLQPFISSSYLRVALHYRASEDGDWTEYGPSFFFDNYGPYTMKLDSAITAKQLRIVMVCTDSAGPAAFPTSFTGSWPYFVPCSGVKCVPVQAGVTAMGREKVAGRCSTGMTLLLSTDGMGKNA